MDEGIWFCAFPLAAGNFNIHLMPGMRRKCHQKFGHFASFCRIVDRCAPVQVSFLSTRPVIFSGIRHPGLWRQKQKPAGIGGLQRSSKMPSQTGSSIRYDAAQIVFLENGVAICRSCFDVFQQAIEPCERRRFGQGETQSGGLPRDPIGGIMGHGAATEDHLRRDAANTSRSAVTDGRMMCGCLWSRASFARRAASAALTCGRISIGTSREDWGF
jgi:hypothetical protein